MSDDPLLDDPEWDRHPEELKEVARVLLLECSEPAMQMLDGKATDVDPIAERIAEQLSPEALAFLAEIHLRRVVLDHLQGIKDNAP